MTIKERPMEIEKVSVSVGITHNMGNYEFLRIDYGMALSISQDEDWEQAIDTARTACNLKLTKDLPEEINWLDKAKARVHGR